MHRKRLTLIALAALVLAGGGWFFSLRSSVPNYEGKTVSYWFKEFYRASDEDELNPTHRHDALGALQKMGTNALPYLVEMSFAPQQDTALRTNLHDFFRDFPASIHAPKFVSWHDIRGSAVVAIHSIQPPTSAVLPLIQRQLDDTNSPNHYTAIEILSGLNGDANLRVPYLAKALHDSDRDSQTRALFSLNVLGVEAKAAVPDLMMLLQDTPSTNFNHGEAAWVLARMGSNAAPAIPMLTECFNRETNWMQQFRLAADLCKIDERQTEMLQFLINGLADRQDTRQAQWSAYQLRAVGTNASPAIPALFKILDTTNFAAWKTVVETLNELGVPDEKLMPKLRDKLNVEDDEFKTLAAKQILLKNPVDKDAQSALLDQIKRHTNHEGEAVIALGAAKTPIPVAVPMILEVLKGTNTESWFRAVRVLQQMGAPPESVLPMLDAKLQNENAWVGEEEILRLEFAGEIQRIEPKDNAARTFMIGLITNDRRLAPGAILRLSGLKPPPEDVLAALRHALKSKDRSTRRYAAEALKKITSPSAGRTNSTAN